MCWPGLETSQCHSEEGITALSAGTEGQEDKGRSGVALRVRADSESQEGTRPGLTF